MNHVSDFGYSIEGQLPGAEDQPTAARTWTITDIDGRNPRTVTLAQFRAEIDARKAAAKPISDALRRGDIEACGAAQVALRAEFPA